MRDREISNELFEQLRALANPQRIRIVAALVTGRNYVSQMARDLDISRPLLHLHLKKLEAAGLVTSTLEISEDGKAMRFFELVPFRIELSAEVIAAMVEAIDDQGVSLSPGSADQESADME